MRQKAIVAATPGLNMEPAPPDLSDVLMFAGWRINFEKRIKEYVTADGRVIDRKPLSQREIDNKEKHTMAGTKKRPDIVIGQQFNELTVKKELADRDKYGLKQYLCDCSCGAEKIVNRTGLLKGEPKSCGHLKKGRPKAGQPKQERADPVRSNKLKKAGRTNGRVAEQAAYHADLQKGMPVIPEAAKMTAFHAGGETPSPEPEKPVEEPETPVVIEQPVQAIAPRTAQVFDLKAAAMQIEAITQLAKAMPLASIAAVRDELRRLKEQPLSPLFSESDKLDEYLAVTNEFYEYRSALEVL